MNAQRVWASLTLGMLLACSDPSEPTDTGGPSQDGGLPNDGSAQIIDADSADAADVRSGPIACGNTKNCAYCCASEHEAYCAQCRTSGEATIGCRTNSDCDAGEVCNAFISTPLNGLGGTVCSDTARGYRVCSPTGAPCASGACQSANCYGIELYVCAPTNKPLSCGGI